jgi:hypothetical protein
MFPLGVPHFSLSPEDLIFWGCPPYLSSDQASPWELDLPEFLQTPHWDVSWPTLGPYTSHLILSPKLIFHCNQAWPRYPLDNASKWPPNGTFDPNILRDLYNFCEHAGKWKKLFYIQSFPYLCTKPSLYTFCSYLIIASDDCFSFPLSCLMCLFPETATGEWRFHFPESVPVPVNGSDLETQVMANPSGLCHASRLCLPLPYLGCQDTFSASSMASSHVLCLCLPFPPWAY